MFIPQSHPEYNQDGNRRAAEDETSGKRADAVNNIGIGGCHKAASDKGTHQRATQGVNRSGICFHFRIYSTQKHVANSSNASEGAIADDSLFKPAFLENMRAESKQPDQHKRHNDNASNEKRQPVSYDYWNLDGSHRAYNQDLQRHSLNSLENSPI